MYDFWVFLHILGAIVGFGTLVAASTVVGNLRTAGADSAQTLANAALRITTTSGVGLVVAFAGGLVAAITAPGDSRVSEPWVSAAMLLVLISIGLVFALVQPGLRRMADTTVTDGNANPAGLSPAVAAGAGICHLLLTVTLVLMIWQPGA